MTTPADPDDLTAWLRWVLDQREAEARLLCSLAGVSGTYLRDLLAEVAADRRILDLHGPYDDFEDCSTCGDVPQVPYPCDTLRLLALPYAGRPGYRPEWSPDVPA